MKTLKCTYQITDVELRFYEVNGIYMEEAGRRACQKANAYNALYDAEVYLDFEPLARLVEQGSEYVLNNPEARKLISDIMTGKVVARKGQRRIEAKRKAQRDSYIASRIHYWLGYGIKPVWSEYDDGICGIVADEMERDGYRRIEPASINKSVWQKHKCPAPPAPHHLSICELMTKAGAIQAEKDCGEG